MSEPESDLLTESVHDVVGRKKELPNMIRFRASALLAIWFFFMAFNAGQAHLWMTCVSDIIIGLCLTACWFGQPIRFGPFEFGGW